MSAFDRLVFQQPCLVENGDGWCEFILDLSPAVERGRIKRSADLNGTCCRDGRGIFVKGEAGRVEVKAAEIQQSACFAFLVGDDRFVVNLGKAILWKCVPETGHHTVETNIVPGSCLKVQRIIVVGKALGRAVKWTGVGSIDKSFGLIFGFFKGYIVSVCIFSISNWFYPYHYWGISAEKALSFNIINKGSEILIDEFPSGEEFIDTKEKIEKI